MQVFIYSIFIVALAQLIGAAPFIGGIGGMGGVGGGFAGGASGFHKHSFSSVHHSHSSSGFTAGHGGAHGGFGHGGIGGIGGVGPFLKDSKHKNKINHLIRFKYIHFKHIREFKIIKKLI
ncbi:hypothetical protein PPACK8108_LOCUS16100 [Phakopsora pachyrhizi]|uniref:Uncharacterized protein n=1 Tax=Phakopsora pachyrhizi TaxID=170000 RepID=A0AAV0BA26_PHAPC|nr:hypothetical protein PPACK8108_LOCUS15591 [Phakopsora pachyrhizi]CAH7682928.1 hypothetical protein PPACK8108_LOCUS16100 [Phakopsora pachyrhizi]